MNERFYKIVFLVGALWNLVGGVVIVVLTDWIFATAGLKPPFPPPYYYSWIALFVTFGFGYYMVYRDMYANKNLIVLGMIGKFSFAVIFIFNIAVYEGQVPLFFLIPVIGDLIFVLLFWMFLRFARKAGR